jgi:HD-GYP domain-containing protein (c-di-GMP phosphodiesterase class II)
MAANLGLSPQRRSTLRRAALLHDVGKLAVPNLILDKPGPLTAGEFDLMKRHPYYTERILANIPEWNRLTEIAATHHEKLDGSGYFRGLTGDELDLDMRLLAVADVYDALSADRPYREAMDGDAVQALLRREAEAARLDPDCIAALPGSGS